MSELSAQLPAGRITVSIEESALPPDTLFTFAARDNPKRAFLFLSHVLGKHLPVTPDIMERIHDRLARTIPALPAPVVFIGMAETATCLGQGVFEAWTRAHPGTPALYLHSTRYRVAGGEAVGFDERHSHAPRQWFYLPAGEQEVIAFRAARSLVLIDDEISTGATFANLAKACARHAPYLQHTHLCTITDFSGEARSEIPAQFSTPLTIGAILRGKWSFAASAAPVGGQAIANAQAHVAPLLADQGFGRMGTRQPIQLCGEDVAAIATPISPDERVLVLGTGEFMHAPFLLARALARRTGADVRSHATTRSPILQWGPIEKSLCFEDNYGEGVRNYLYNFARSDYDHVFLCHEAGASHHLPPLASLLNASLLSFHAGGRIERSAEAAIH